MFCPNCDYKNPATARSCENCGVDLPRPAGTPEDENANICPECGAKNEPDALLCSLCGKSFGSESAPEAAPAAAPRPSVSRLPDDDDDSLQPASAKQSPNIALLVVMGIIVVAFAGYWFTKGSVQLKKPLSATFADTLAYANGEPFDSSKLDGKKGVVLYFGASWCPGCNQAAPMLANFYNENRGGEEWEVVFVGQDQSAAKQQIYVDKYSMPWPVVDYDSPVRLSIISECKLPHIPYIVLFTPKGKMVANSSDGNYVKPDQVFSEVRKLIQ